MTASINIQTSVNANGMAEIPSSIQKKKGSIYDACKVQTTATKFSLQNFGQAMGILFFHSAIFKATSSVKLTTIKSFLVSSIQYSKCRIGNIYMRKYHMDVATYDDIKQILDAITGDR